MGMRARIQISISKSLHFESGVLIYQDSSENWHPNQTWLTLYFPVAPTAAGRWGLNWVRTHWSSDIPKPDQIEQAVHISGANASD